MAETVDAAGLPAALGPVDYLLHRGEANPRTRSGIMALELLDTTPDWDRFRSRFENASRRVLRLRQKVVVPTLPTAAPRWVVDPDFNLDFHVRRMRVAEPGTLRQVFDLAEVMLQSPLDIARPLWTATLIEGLADGKAATLLHLSPRRHRRCRQCRDVRPDLRPRARSAAPADAAATHSAGSVGQRLDARRAQPPARATSSAGSWARCRERYRRSGGRCSTPGPRWRVSSATPRSGVRVVSRAAEPSPLLRRRSLATRSEAHRHPAGRPAPGRESRRRLDQRRLPGRLVRCAGALPRGTRRADRHAADGGAGQPAGRIRRGRRQPVHRCQPGGPDRYRRSGSSHAEDPRADDPAPRRARDGHHRFHRTGAECVAGTACWSR